MKFNFKLIITIILLCGMIGLSNKLKVESDIERMIPGEELRKLIKYEVGKNEEQDLTIEDILSIEEIKISYYDGIKYFDRNLEGIQYLTNLEVLELDEIKLDSLVYVSALPKLKKLILNNVLLTDLVGLKRLETLEVLELDSLYRMSNMDELAHLTNLTQLTLKEIDWIGKLPDLSLLESLITVIIDHNQADNFTLEDFKEVRNLKKLEIHTQLIDNLLFLVDVPLVNTLILQADTVKSLDGIQLLLDLERFDIISNEYNDVEESLDLSYLESLTKLEVIRVDNRKVENIQWISKLENMNVLSLPDNLISDFGAIQMLNNLEFLDLSNNPMSELTKECFTNLNKLKVLKLNGLNISDLNIINDLVNLETIEFQNNRISDISPLSFLVELKEINLNDNLISDISILSRLDNLEVLFASGNMINELLDLSERSKLIELDLSDNDIIDICKLKNNKTIRKLDLSKNSISDGSCLDGNKSIKEIHFDGNRLNDLTFLKDTEIIIERSFNKQYVELEAIWGQETENPLINYRGVLHEFAEVESSDGILIFKGRHMFIDEILPTSTFESVKDDLIEKGELYLYEKPGQEVEDYDAITVNEEDVNAILFHEQGNYEFEVRYYYNYKGEILELKLLVGIFTPRGVDVDFMQLLFRPVPVYVYIENEDIITYNTKTKTISPIKLGETEIRWLDNDCNTAFSGSGILRVIPAKAKVHYVNLEGEEISATKLFQGKHGESIPAEELVIEDYKLVEAPIEKVFNGRMVEIYYRYRPKGEARLVSEDLTMKLSDYTKMVEAGKLPNILKELMNVRYFDQYDNEILNLEHIKVDDSKVELKKGNYVITFSENQGSKKVTTESILTLEDDQPNIEEEPGTTYNLAADDVTMTLTELKKAIDDEILDSKVILLSKAEIISSSQLRFRFLSLRSPYIFKADLQFVREEIGQYPVEISTEINGKRYAKNIVLTITDDLTQIGKIEAQNVRMHIKDYIEAKDLGKEKSVIINESKPKYTGKQVVSEDAYQLDTHLIETKAGNYKAIISVEIEGNRIETTINVELYDDNKELPKTGINSGVMLWSQMIAIGVLLLSNKKVSN